MNFIVKRTGTYSSIREACEKIVVFDEKITSPNPDWEKFYDEKFAHFHKIYPANKELFTK